MRMRKVLAEVFGKGGPITTAVAPGRVNLIGEHTDYNHGFVFPMAIGLSIELAGRLRGDRQVQIYAADYREKVSFSLDEPLTQDPVQRWSNYGRGVLWALQQAGVELRGVELVLGGDLPKGAGLSSSAALEIATALVLQDLLGFDMAANRLAQLCQQAEGDFVGLKCGIMDQLSVLCAQSDHALLLDCRSLEIEQVPLELGNYRVVVCHSGVKHDLVASEYNRRRQECATGVRALQARFPRIGSLRDADLSQLEQCWGELDEVVFRRCRHVISENGRVLESVQALRQGDLRRFGQLINASHDSLRDDYQVSCPEVDRLVDLARSLPGVLGARITGGGFGGCTVNLVPQEVIEDFRRVVLGEYQRVTGVIPRLFVSSPVDGARIVQRGL